MRRHASAVKRGIGRLRRRQKVEVDADTETVNFQQSLLWAACVLLLLHLLFPISRSRQIHHQPPISHTLCNGAASLSLMSPALPLVVVTHRLSCTASSFYCPSIIFQRDGAWRGL